MAAAKSQDFVIASHTPGNDFPMSRYSQAAVLMVSKNNSSKFRLQDATRTSNANVKADIAAVLAESITFCTERQEWLKAARTKLRSVLDALAVAPAAVALPAAGVEIPACNGVDGKGRRATYNGPVRTIGYMHLNPKYYEASYEQEDANTVKRNSAKYCFFAAAKVGCIHCLDQALKCGMAVNARSDNEGHTALAWAQFCCQRDAAQFLFDQGGVL